MSKQADFKNYSNKILYISKYYVVYEWKKTGIFFYLLCHVILLI